MIAVDVAFPHGVRGRVIALALLLLVLSAGWLGILAPLLEWYAARGGTIIGRQAMLVHASRLVGSLPELQRGLPIAPINAPLLDGQTDAVAAAGLQEIVQEIAAVAGASLKSSEALSGPVENGFRPIGLRITLQAEWPVVVALLQALEANPRRWQIDNLHLVMSGQGIGVGQVEAGLVVIGYRAVSSAEAARSALPTL